jgi:hypothetical protein
MVDRVSAALGPHYTAIVEVARTALVHYIDETSWLLHGDRQWLWVMANPAVAYFQIHPHRSKTTFMQLIDDWRGILVSDGSRLYGDVIRRFHPRDIEKHPQCLPFPIQTPRNVPAWSSRAVCWRISERKRAYHMRHWPTVGRSVPL